MYRYGYGGTTNTEASRIASVLSGSFQVSIKPGQGWYYDFSTDTIHYQKKDLSFLSEDDVTANLLHQCGHARYSTSPNKYKWSSVPPKHQKILEMLINVFEDFRIEDKLRSKYPYAKDFLPSYSFKTRSEIDFYRENVGKVTDYLSYIAKVYEQLGGFTHTKMFFREANSDVLKVVEETKHLFKKAVSSKNTQGVVDVVEKIYPFIKKWLEQDEKESNSYDPEVTNAEQYRQILYLLEENGQATKRAGISYGGQDTHHNFSYREMYAEIKPLIRPLKTSLNKILVDRKFDKFEGKYRSGKLNQARLYRFATGDYRLFQRRIESETKNYVFGLLVDTSSSMYGYEEHSPIFQAIASAMLLANVLNDLSIPFGIWGFNRRQHTYKNPEDPFTPKSEKLFEEIFKEEKGNGDTRLASALKVFSNKLLPYPGRKVFITMTDGEANIVYDGDPKTVVDQTTKQGIRHVGVGIKQDVSSSFNEYVNISDVSKLPETIGAVLKNTLKY